MKKQTLFITLLLIIIVFSIGVILGNSWQSSKSSEINKILQQSELDAESFLTEQELFESFETNCALASERLGSLSQELWKLGNILGTQDAQNLGEQDYSFLKRKYHLMQIRTYVLNKKLQQDCGSTTNVVIFYFQKNDPASDQQGKILDELVKQYDLRVFAIEHDYSKELEFLEDYYEIDAAPALVVNYEHVLKGLADKQQITPLFYG